MARRTLKTRPASVVPVFVTAGGWMPLDARYSFLAHRSKLKGPPMAAGAWLAAGPAPAAAPGGAAGSRSSVPRAAMAPPGPRCEDGPDAAAITGYTAPVVCAGLFYLVAGPAATPVPEVWSPPAPRGASSPASAYYPLHSGPPQTQPDM